MGVAPFLWWVWGWCGWMSVQRVNFLEFDRRYMELGFKDHSTFRGQGFLVPLGFLSSFSYCYSGILPLTFAFHSFHINMSILLFSPSGLLLLDCAAPFFSTPGNLPISRGSEPFSILAIRVLEPIARIKVFEQAWTTINLGTRNGSLQDFSVPQEGHKLTFANMY